MCIRDRSSSRSAIRNISLCQMTFPASRRPISRSLFISFPISSVYLRLCCASSRASPSVPSRIRSWEIEIQLSGVSVSYTHLDVYKRQACRKGCLSCITKDYLHLLTAFLLTSLSALMLALILPGCQLLSPMVLLSGSPLRSSILILGPEISLSQK